MESNDINLLINDNLKRLRAKIEDSCTKTWRPSSEITLVAVTKTVPTEKIERAIESGIKAIGENRVQEAQEKFSIIGNKAEWHLIGHLQTNKVKKAMEIFSVIQSVDSLHLAQEIEKRASTIPKVIPVLIEVNTSQEETKFGVEPSRLFGLVRDVLSLSHIKISGLMTIGPGLAVEDKEKSRPCFRLLYELKQRAEKEFGVSLPYLSMGMSSDFEVGIEEGSNMIRVGTAIFGARSK
jgi:hypothetical protein